MTQVGVKARVPGLAPGRAMCECPFCGYERRQRRERSRRQDEAREEAQRARRSTFAAVADLACVHDYDEVGRAQFILELGHLVDLIHEWKHAPRKLLFSDNSPVRQRVLTAAKTLRAANAALAVFEGNAPLLIYLAQLACPGAFRHGRWAADDNWLASLRTLTVGMSALAGVPAPLTSRGGKRGRPAGSRNDWLLSLFVTALHERAVDGRGKFTASHKDGKGYGTMFEALELLRPHLPPGFLRTNAVQAIVSATNERKNGTRGVPDRYVRNSK